MTPEYPAAILEAFSQAAVHKLRLYHQCEDAPV